MGISAKLFTDLPYFKMLAAKKRENLTKTRSLRNRCWGQNQGKSRGCGHSTKGRKNKLVCQNLAQKFVRGILHLLHPLIMTPSQHNRWFKCFRNWYITSRWLSQPPFLWHIISHFQAWKTLHTLPKLFRLDM